MDMETKSDGLQVRRPFAEPGMSFGNNRPGFISVTNGHPSSPIFSRAALQRAFVFTTWSLYH
jgi:hypothetical protein